MYISNNAYKLFGPVIAATHLHFMFIFKVDFVTLAQIISENQP